MGALAVVALILAGPPPASAKWETPMFQSPNGMAKATIYYGPWKCTQQWIDECRVKCVEKSYTAMGCIWIADFSVQASGYAGGYIPFESGGKYSFTHCCCSYPKSPDRKKSRTVWDSNREGYRENWVRDYGPWPKDPHGDNWPGHHIHDLARGGDPLSDVLPMPPAIHPTVTKAYEACYAGSPDWSDAGPSHPYAD